jgi:hypothetical protein
MQVAAGALANELKVAYLSPAVYPPDTRVPVAAVARYWHQLRGATVRLEIYKSWPTLNSCS